MSGIFFYPAQKEAIDKLKSGSILCGGVGTGKSITSLGYFFERECGGFISDRGEAYRMTRPKNLYIITTARKRDTHEWDKECDRFPLGEINVFIDSWNNIGKYVNVEGAFFIFDEQRVVGSGAWAKSFVKISRRNKWILLSATPGDTWSDYIPVFIANGFYKNKTEFVRRHCVFSRFSKYPKIDRYLDVGRLEMLRRSITVNIDYEKSTVPHYETIVAEYDKDLYNKIVRDRWDIYADEPIQNISKLGYLLRRVVNSDMSRISLVKKLMEKHERMIIFYNLDCERDWLRTLSTDILIAEWNGERHEPVPECQRWLYLVQYAAGAEGWNCIQTDTIIFFSQSYSYKMTKQAAGRIDRLNTPYRDLYYYTISSDAPIDKAIARALKNKRNFNESSYLYSLDDQNSRQEHAV